MEGPTEQKGYGKFYGKRPLWQWILIYLVVALVVYGIIYYLIWGRNGGYSTNSKTSNNTSSNTFATTHSEPDTGYAVITGSGGPSPYTVAGNGFTLYVSTADSTGVSNCTGSCTDTWPPYKATVSTGLPENVSVITRPDGSKQYAYKGMPLYYYIGDTKEGQTNGNDLGTFKLATP